MPELHRVCHQDGWHLDVPDRRGEVLQDGRERRDEWEFQDERQGPVGFLASYRAGSAWRDKGVIAVLARYQVHWSAAVVFRRAVFVREPQLVRQGDT